MYADVRHRGVWLPAHALHDQNANDRLAKWIPANVPNLDNRVIVTPLVTNPVDDPPILRALARGAPHRGANGGPDWQWCSGPVVLAWPNDQLLETTVPMATDQTLILFEWSDRISFEGWATATEAYNAATGETVVALPEDQHEKFVQMLFYDTELVGGARRGPGREHPQRYLRELGEAGLNEDFVVTYTLALNHHIDPKHIREHFRAATGQIAGKRR